MLVNDIVNQLMHLSVDGCIDGRQITRKALAEMIRKDVLPGSPKLHRITLLDGAWWVKIEMWGNGHDNYDYWLPTDRDEERKMMGVSVTRQHPDRTGPLANRHVNLAPTL